MDGGAGQLPTRPTPAKLGALVTQYRAWIEAQRRKLPALPAQRHETAEELLKRAAVAAQRIEDGMQLLADPVSSRPSGSPTA